MSTAVRIDGKAAASAVLAEVAVEVAELRREGTLPGLAVVLVGDDPASQVYVKNKVRTAAELGVRSVEHRIDAAVSQASLIALVQALNADDSVHGILVQMPLPGHLDAAAVIDTIRPDKDVDGFHRENVGGLSLGQEVLTPCTPAGCMYLLRQVVGDLKGKHAVIVGRSNIVGKPMAALLLQADCSVTVLHSRSVNPEAICRQGDIVVAAVGKAGLIDAAWLKPGAVVIDVGINRVSVDGVSKLKGDVDFDSAMRVASAVTPVPGGVGPMTIAFLMRNTVIAAKKQGAALAKR